MTDKKVSDYMENLYKDVKKSGYNLNSDKEFLMDLGEGLLINKERYGYEACPCRKASGNIEDDMDIICPCDYRDMDLTDFGSCYCGLYVTQDILDGKKELTSITDRRKSEKEKTLNIKTNSTLKSKYPIWRCKVCGYLCSRGTPPEKCPICKAQKERFEIL